MKRNLILVASALALTVPALAPEAASARPHHTKHYKHRTTYYRDCSGGNGAVGTIAGGVGGALIGNAIGGGIGTVAGGVGGALLGRHLDKQHTRARHGCRR